MLRYVSWQELAAMLPKLIGVEPGRRTQDRHGIQPRERHPLREPRRRRHHGTGRCKSTGAEIVSSADLVQLVEAVLTPEQLASHRRAAAVCLAAKDAAFAFIAQKPA